MSELIVTLKGLKKVSEVGLPTPLEVDDRIESVYILTRNGSASYNFGLATYNFETKLFRIDNGYGGEIWEPDSVIAWCYWMEDELKIEVEE